MIIPVNDARELHTARADRFNARDVEGMLALAETESVFVVTWAGRIALVIADWSIKGTGADGSNVDMSVSTVDNSFGTG
jgi:hypothetical protein